mmetsp:Transcript_9157/g.19726  ORF Transcript_9157/g.19726 Transcript_9157/m.19726 type:complete len:114 (-) Transcript_9157:8-349(-)
MEENMYEGEFYMLYVMANMSEGVKFQYCEGKRKRRTIFGTRDWGYFLQFLGRENERLSMSQQQPNVYDRGLESCGVGTGYFLAGSLCFLAHDVSPPLQCELYYSNYYLLQGSI